MTLRRSCFWLVCCGFSQSASANSYDFKDTLVSRSHNSGSLYGDLDSVTVQKPGQLRSPSGTTFNRGIARIPRGIQFSGMQQSPMRPGFNKGGASGSLYPPPQPTQGRSQHGNQAPAVRAAFWEVEEPPVQQEQGVQEVHSEDVLDSVVQQSDEPVLVEFTTTWCGPCKIFAPIYDKMASQYSGKAKFLKVTVNENEATSSLAKRFQVRAIPSFLLFHNKEIVAQETGVKVETKLRHSLNACMR